MELELRSIFAAAGAESHLPELKPGSEQLGFLTLSWNRSRSQFTPPELEPQPESPQVFRLRIPDNTSPDHIMTGHRPSN